MYSNIGIILIFLVVAAQTANKIDPPQLNQIKVRDQSEIVKLADQQKFLIPRLGNTINVSIQYIPENQGQCEQIPQSMTYQSLAQSPSIFQQSDSIVEILPLIKRQTVFVADPYYNIASYSIDQHFLMKPRIPRTSLINNGLTSQNYDDIISPIMVASQNQEYILYFTNKKSFVFHYNNIASDKKQINIPNQPSSILKAIIVQSYLILCSGVEGVYVYHIDYDTYQLVHLQTVKPEGGIDNAPTDIQFNKNTQLLYVLTFLNKVEVYIFKPDQNIPLKQRQVLFHYDEISLQKIIKNHNSQQSNIQQFIGNFDLQISSGRQQQNLIILFYHLDKTVIAEVSYHPDAKQYFFVRYFKYAVTIRQIHAISDEVLLVVGDDVLGMFPYGIDPHLINQQFNGYMALSSVNKIQIVQPPFFVGINKNTVEYGGIFLNKQTGITCHLSETSKLKQIKFKANLTTCQKQQSLKVDQYCAYEKTFIMKSMRITASANVAASIWIATIVLTLLLIFGLCCLFAIHKKKQRQIRKLQLYFQEKRRASEIPASSDRK